MRRRASAAVAATVIGICSVLWQAVPASQQLGWTITDLDGGYFSPSDIAVDATGNALTVWEKRERIASASFSIASGTWTPALLLSNPQDYATVPRVAANAAGEAVAVWRGVKSSNATSYVGLARHSAATRTWSQVLEIPANGYWPRAVIDAHGTTTVVWAEWIRDDPPSIWSFYDYPVPVYEVRSVRHDATTVSLSPVATLSGEGAGAPQVGIDGVGNVTVAWARDRVESTRWSFGGNRWSDVAALGQIGSSIPQIAANSRGEVVAVWLQSGGLWGALSPAGSATWSPESLISPTQGTQYSAGIDAAGNVTVAWEHNGRLHSTSFQRSTNSWTEVAEVASVGPFGGATDVTVDPEGNAMLAWTGGFLPWTGGSSDQSVHVARRPFGGEWGTLTTFPAASGPLRMGSDDAGNILLLLIERPALTLQAARWKAPLGRPSIAHVTSKSGALSIDVRTPRVLDPADAVLNYEYSIDDGVTWTARIPASPASPVVLDGLIDGEEYPVRLRAVDALGPGTPSEGSILIPGLVAPANLTIASVTGNTVTFVWNPPPGGVPLTGYMIEGGAAPGTSPIRLPRAGTGTVFTVAAPNGIFYVRVRATRGRSESEPSNEVVLNVGVPAAPSAPTNLLGLTDGGHLALTWQNTFTGGAPSEIVLDVSGDRSESIPLGGVDERFSFSVVPFGTYTFTVRAVNATDTSSASNAVTLTFPGTCSAPQTPTSLSLAKQSDTISAFWSLPASGAAPTGYVLHVTGAINQSFNLTERTVTGTVPRGTYTISVSAANACGFSAPTPAKTITIP